MIETIQFNGKDYPALTSVGFAARFAIPFANMVCTGMGYDIGCNRKEWSLSGSIPIDPAIAGCEYEAMKLPPLAVNYIFSSHCLEHLADWVGALDYWHTRLHPGGVLFLYLPHPEQEYWLPFNNRKHIHSLCPSIIKKYFQKGDMWKNVFVTEGYDLNYSFYAIAEKK